VIETVESAELAAQINSRLTRKTEVMIQVHTSAEETKSGCDPDKVQQIASFIDDQCPNLELIGLMTIGDPNSPKTGF